MGEVVDVEAGLRVSDHEAEIPAGHACVGVGDMRPGFGQGVAFIVRGQVVRQIAAQRDDCGHFAAACDCQRFAGGAQVCAALRLAVFARQHEREHGGGQHHDDQHVDQDHAAFARSSGGGGRGHCEAGSSMTRRIGPSNPPVPVCNCIVHSIAPGRVASRGVVGASTQTPCLAKRQFKALTPLSNT